MDGEPRYDRRLEGYGLADFATSSPAMRRLVELARRVAASDSSLLILGETGVGKEWLARAIHAEGRRRAAPFIAVNCAAVPDTLLESELFGHEKGSFTGATRSRRGHFELAHGGTIFLDEIADMSPHLQAKLLRVLQERRIQRVGAEREVEIDVRLMAATNRDLERAMSQREFRRDLYYRLSTISLTVPPLRERREDIPLLVDTYLEQFRRQLARAIAEVRADALEALLDYPWPGNVRELINVMERAVLLCTGSEITPSDLPDDLLAAAGRDVRARDRLAEVQALGEDWLERPLAEVRSAAVAAVESRYLEEQLRRARGRVGETARRAGIGPRALHTLMKKHDLRKEDFK